MNMCIRQRASASALEDTGRWTERSSATATARFVAGDCTEDGRRTPSVWVSPTTVAHRAHRRRERRHFASCSRSTRRMLRELSTRAARQPRRRRFPVLSAPAVQRVRAQDRRGRAQGAHPRVPRHELRIRQRPRRAARRRLSRRSSCSTTGPRTDVGRLRRAGLPGAARSSQIIFVPGGFSGGDEPDGSGQVHHRLLPQRREVRDATMDLLEKPRRSRCCGICNGFQALIKLGLVPYGEIIDTGRVLPDADLQHHRRATSRVWCAPASPPTALRGWPARRSATCTPSPSPTVRAASCAARSSCASSPTTARSPRSMWTLTAVPGMDVHFNPNGSIWAIEGITSPDGRVLGKMGHAERIGDGLYQERGRLLRYEAVHSRQRSTLTVMIRRGARQHDDGY